jgi:pimeloyl-ACP methyl ester carboxylesterase
MDSSGAAVEPATIRPGRWLLLYAAGILAVGLMTVVAYFAVDPERHDLDDAARRAAPGQFVRLSDGMTHYEIAGPENGRLVVLAAGTSVPYYIWDPTFDALIDANFRVVRYDYYGRGYSDRPDIAYGQDLYVRQLVELLEALHVEVPVDLAGLSFGGSVITSVADRYPDRVRSLVFVDPAFRTPQPVSMLASMPAAWSFLAALFDERGWADGQLQDFVHPDRFPEWPERYREQLQFRGFRRARLSDLVTNADFDQRPELERVGRAERPVLVVWGRQDPNVPFEFNAALLKAMPRARLVAVDDAGHLPQWEQPAIVNEAIVAFLRRQPS